MRMIAAVLVAMLLAGCANQYTRFAETPWKPAQERMIEVSAKGTKEGGVSTAVELAKACAEESYKDNKRHCKVLRYMQKAIADCGLNGLSPPTDACGRANIRREDLRTEKRGFEGLLMGMATMMPLGNVASIAKACAEENDKDACDAVQSIQTLADCGLNPNANACDQPIAEAKARWPSVGNGDNE